MLSQGTMHIRYLNWNECLSPSRATKAATAASRQRHALGAAQEASDGGDASQHTLQASQHTLQASQHTTQESQHTTQASQHTTQASQPPAVHPDMRFDVVLATDVLYEADMAYGVAAAVRQYLQHTGRALIVNAVRYPVRGDVTLYSHCVEMVFEMVSAPPLSCHTPPPKQPTPPRSSTTCCSSASQRRALCTMHSKLTRMQQPTQSCLVCWVQIRITKADLLRCM